MLKSKTNTLTNHKRSKQRDEPIRIPLAITGDFLKAWEKSRAQGAGVISQSVSRAITICIITFDIRLKTALSNY